MTTRDEIEKELLKVKVNTIDNYFEDEEGRLVILDTTWELFDEEETWEDTDSKYVTDKYKNDNYDFIITIGYDYYVSYQGDEVDLSRIDVDTTSLIDMFTHKEVINKIKTLENLKCFRV